MITLAAELERIMNRTGVLAVWAWEPTAADRTEHGPRLRGYAGRIRREQATAGMYFLEALLTSALHQGNLLSDRGGGELFESPRSVCVRGRDLTVLATENRFAVSFLSNQRLDYWMLVKELTGVRF